MHLFRSCGHVVGGSLLIAGTTIGVGMLALPVATGPAGFFPAVVMYLLCYAFMLCTGLLLLEVCSWMPKDSNLITMASNLMGPFGKWICWAVYLFLFITVMIAHVAGGGDIVSQIFHGALPPWGAMILYVLAFAPAVYLGTHSVDRINLILISGVAITYFLFVWSSLPSVDLALLKHENWSLAWLALPILFTSFTYQVIIPTLVTYMDKDVKKVRLTIICGTTIPLIVYLIWEFLILGIVPAEGVGSLTEAALKGHNAVTPLKEILHNPFLFTVGKAFAFLTMTTSFIGLSLAFLDFLADGLRVKKTHTGKFFLCLAIFLPPLTISLIYPDVFLQALNYAGGFSCAILFGLFPPIMAWIGRYVKKHPGHPYLIPGGRPLLIFLVLFVLVELALEFYQTFR